ncbi:hypothetical protein ACEU6E_02880 [Halorutilales archaeon Cl-col2-1]
MNRQIFVLMAILSIVATPPLSTAQDPGFDMNNSTFSKTGNLSGVSSDGSNYDFKIGSGPYIGVDMNFSLLKNPISPDNKFQFETYGIMNDKRIIEMDINIASKGLNGTTPDFNSNYQFDLNLPFGV